MSTGTLGELLVATLVEPPAATDEDGALVGAALDEDAVDVEVEPDVEDALVSDEDSDAEDVGAEVGTTTGTLVTDALGPVTSVDVDAEPGCVNTGTPLEPLSPDAVVVVVAVGWVSTGTLGELLVAALVEPPAATDEDGALVGAMVDEDAVDVEAAEEGDALVAGTEVETTGGTGVDFDVAGTLLSEVDSDVGLVGADVGTTTTPGADGEVGDHEPSGRVGRARVGRFVGLVVADVPGATVADGSVVAEADDAGTLVEPDAPAVVATPGIPGTTPVGTDVLAAEDPTPGARMPADGELLVAAAESGAAMSEVVGATAGG